MDFPEIQLWLKFLIAIIWDVLDLTIFRIPGLGSFADLFGTFLAIALWGYEGILAFWEVPLDPLDQIDSFVPTLTIIGIISWLRSRGYETGEITSKMEVIKGGVKR